MKPETLTVHDDSTSLASSLLFNKHLVFKAGKAGRARMVISVLHMKKPMSREIILPNITQVSQAEATTYSWMLFFSRGDSTFQNLSHYLL